MVLLRKQQKGNKRTERESEWMMRRSSGWKMAKDEQHRCLVIGRHKKIGMKLVADDSGVQGPFYCFLCVHSHHSHVS